MNLLLLSPCEINPDLTATLTDQRAEHIINTHRAQVGDTLKAGIVDGALGLAQIQAMSQDSVTVCFQAQSKPAAATPLTLILSLPRPKMLRRILQSVTSLGVKDIYLVNSARVEKSYWQTPFLQPAALRQQLLLGLAQGVDTALPRISLQKRLKPFVEDELPNLCEGRQCWLAHPGDYPYCPTDRLSPGVLAVGPEGGFVPFEVDLFTQAGFDPITIGQRILRVETAVPALISRLYQL